jgi:sarcosine oxidase
VHESYDAIVVGLGAMGSAATYQLARRGLRVLGIEMFQPGHDRGSSHGHHRMIRKSSFGVDGYVPLADRAFALWRELEEVSGQSLLRLTGEVWLLHEAGNPDYRAGVEYSIARGFRVVLSEQELAERFPGFRLHDGMIALYEAEAGFIRSELAIVAHVEQARRHGATVCLDDEVTGWAVDGGGVRVETRQGAYQADRLILTAGPWSAELLGKLRLPMQVERRVNGFFRPARPDWWTLERGAPDFLLDVPEGSFYGMPSVDGIGVKIGVSAGEVTTARTIRRTIDDDEIDFFRAPLDKYLPGAAGEELRRITCMCTYTVDRHFVIDRHPEHDQVLFGCGFSGRGFKFSPVVGEILADLAVEGPTRHEIGFLAVARFTPRHDMLALPHS